MVAFYPHFVSCGEKATLKDVVGKPRNSIISLELYRYALLSCLSQAIQTPSEAEAQQ